MSELTSWLSGKKTNVVGGGAIVATIAAWANGQLDIDWAAVFALIGTVAMTLRAALAKVELEVKRMKDELTRGGKA